MYYCKNLKSYQIIYYIITNSELLALQYITISEVKPDNLVPRWATLVTQKQSQGSPAWF